MSDRPILPQAPVAYDPQQMQVILNAIADLFAQSLMTNGDIRIPSPIRLVLPAPDGGEWVVGVNNAGVVTTSTYP